MDKKKDSIKKLLKKYKSDPDSESGIKVAFKIYQLRQKKLIALLIKALANPDDDVYKAAFNSLVKLGEIVVVPVIEEALKNKNPLIRYRAILIFDKVRDKRAVAPLIKLLNKDKDSDVRRAAAGVLAGLPEDSQIGQALITALKDKDSAVRYHSAISLGMLRVSEAVPLLIKLLGDEDEEVRGHSAFALGQCGGSEVVEPLLPLLEDKSASVRMWTTWALAWKDDWRSIDPLIKRLKDVDPRVRETAVGSIITYQRIEGINRAIPPLIRLLLDDESSSIRYAAAEALGCLGDNEVVSVLEKVQSNDFEIGNLNYPVSKAAAEAINNIKDRHGD